MTNSRQSWLSALRTWIVLGDALFIYPSGEGALYRNGSKPEDLFVHLGQQVKDCQLRSGVLYTDNYTMNRAFNKISSTIRSSLQFLRLSRPSPAYLPGRILPFRGLATRYWAALVPKEWLKSAPLRRDMNGSEDSKSNVMRRIRRSPG